MADDTNEDSWLYGTSNPDSTTNEEDRGEPDTQDGSADSPTDGTAANDDTVPSGAAARNGNEADSAENEGDQSPDTNEHEHKEQETADDPANEMEEQDEEGEIVDRDGGDSDLDDSDDDINVVIGDIKSGPTTATTYNIKQRANLIAPTAVIAQEKPKPSAGKFSIEEFESVGTINGVPAHEFSIDSLDEKPWRKPGADITDYFNYGFNEETWRSYCERQKRFRIGESGVGLQGLAAGGPNIITQSMPNNRTLTPLTNNDNSKYVNQLGPPRRPGPPTAPAKENVIQVMTAERREYSRPGGPPFGDQYFEPDSYNYGYEPTQDSQWMNDNAGWAPTGIKELTPGPPQMLPLPMGGMGPPPPHMVIRPPMPIPNMVPMPPPHMAGMNMMPPARVMPNNPTERDNRERERERPDRERDRERERERERERDRERDWPARDERERERREREHDRHRDRGKSEESERPAGNESPTRERERRRRERERDRERTKRERSHSRERSSRRRSRSRDKDRDRKSRDKKKHRKDKEDSE